MVTPFAGYEEKIDTFFFREKGSITIPKSVRRKAYTLALDLEIISVAAQVYMNYKSNPAFGFYGYVVLVMQDFSEIQIPIEQPRQRIYYGEVVEAFQLWYNLYLFYVTEDIWKYLINTRLSRIETAVGLSVDDASFQCPSPPVWIELPLREVYVKCPYGTSFSLEVSHNFPKPMDYGKCSFDGYSGQTDGNKDRGLPSRGVQPQVAANPNSPYENFPPPSNDATLGDFKNSKEDGLDKPNENNLSKDGSKYIVEISYTYYSACPKIYKGFEYYELQPRDSIYLVTSTGSDRCGVYNPNISWFRTSDKGRLGGGEIIAVSGQRYFYANSVPPSYSTLVSG